MADTLAAVIVAAGSGRRFSDAGIPKQYRELCGQPLLAWALRPFLSHPAISRTVVVLPPDDVATPPEWLRQLPVQRVAGGAERGDSVRSGLAALDDAIATVLVHDGARPLLTRALLDRVIDAAKTGAVVPGLPIVETVKEVDEQGLIRRTVDRSRYWRVQTPQAFPRATLLECHERAAEEGLSLTDDAAILERYGHPVRIVEGDPENVKVTTTTDFAFAELLARRLPEFSGSGRLIQG